MWLYRGSAVREVHYPWTIYKQPTSGQGRANESYLVSSQRPLGHETRPETSSVDEDPYDLGKGSPSGRVQVGPRTESSDPIDTVWSPLFTTEMGSRITDYLFFVENRLDWRDDRRTSLPLFFICQKGQRIPTLKKFKLTSHESGKNRYGLPTLSRYPLSLLILSERGSHGMSIVVTPSTVPDTQVWCRCIPVSIPTSSFPK